MPHLSLYCNYFRLWGCCTAIPKSLKYASQCETPPRRAGFQGKEIVSFRIAPLDPALKGGACGKRFG